jgi:hypothetical protein
VRIGAEGAVLRYCWHRLKITDLSFDRIIPEIFAGNARYVVASGCLGGDTKVSGFIL